MNAAGPASPRIEVACFGRDSKFALAVVRMPPGAGADQALLATWLAGNEPARAARFVVDHARADFLAGRIAAKSAVRALRPDAAPPGTWEVAGALHKPPRLPEVFRGSGITLAHSSGVGVALAHPASWRCGVDLEPADRDAGDVIATQVAPAEAAWARAAADADEQRVRWLVLWTAREALGKSLGTGLLEPGGLAVTKGWVRGVHGWRAGFEGKDNVAARSVIAGGFVVSFVLPFEADTESPAQWLARVLEK